MKSARRPTTPGLTGPRDTHVQAQRRPPARRLSPAPRPVPDASGSVVAGQVATDVVPFRKSSRSSSVHGEEGSFAASLGDEAQEALLAAGRIEQLQRSARLYTEGDVVSRVLVVLIGAVKLSHYAGGGREVILGIRGPGDVLGEPTREASWFDHSGVVAASGEVLTVEPTAWWAFLDEHPPAATAFSRLLPQRLHAANADCIALAMNDTLGRVAARLLELANRFGRPDGRLIRVSLPLSQQELAAWAGASREATSRALHQLRGRGLIEVERREITVLDMEALRLRAHVRLQG